MKRVILRHHRIGCKDATQISNFLFKNEYLHELYISHNKIGSKGATKIANSSLKIYLCIHYV